MKSFGAALYRRWPVAVTGVVLGWVLAALGMVSGYQHRAFDAYIHMFFADHYARDWFSLWESRWYGGFSVASYPPLAHQAVALVGRFVGMEMGFVVVMALAMALFPIAMWAAARAFVGEREAGIAVLLCALWPTLHRFAYDYGQLPHTMAAVLALFSIGALQSYVVRGGGTRLVLFGALVGSVAATHHMSVVLAAGGCGIVALRSLWLPGGNSRQALVARVVAAGALAGLVIVIAIWPFVLFARQAPVQAEIPHFSREPLAERGLTLEVVEQLVVLGLGLCCTFWMAWRRAWPAFALGLGALLFCLLAMGATTPVPELLFGKQWRWLTYDKFHHWSCLLLLPVFGATVGSLPKRWLRPGVALVAWGLLPLALLAMSHRSAQRLQPPYVDDFSAVLARMNVADAPSYRHLTLGFGDQFVRLDMATASPNLDGNYHTARQDPLLWESGIATLDASKYYSRGTEVLSKILMDASDRHLRWVVVYDEWYYTTLFEAGFSLVDVWENGVALFEKQVPPLVAAPVPPRTVWNYSWGIAPLLLLGCALGTGVWLLVRRELLPVM